MRLPRTLEPLEPFDSAQGRLMEPLERLEPAAILNGLNGSNKSIRNDMADIVVCGDLECEIEKSGELSKLAVGPWGRIFTGC
jgi:hypothetical protein